MRSITIIEKIKKLEQVELDIKRLLMETDPVSFPAYSVENIKIIHIEFYTDTIEKRCVDEALAGNAEMIPKLLSCIDKLKILQKTAVDIYTDENTKQLESYSTNIRFLNFMIDTEKINLKNALRSEYESNRLIIGDL